MALVTVSCPLKPAGKGTTAEVGGPWVRVAVVEVNVTVAVEAMAAPLMVPLMVAVPCVADEVRVAV